MTTTSTSGTTSTTTSGITFPAASKTTRRRRIAATAKYATTGTTLAVLLASCSFSIGTPNAAGDGVSFDDLQSATIQLEAVGTFVSPEEGGYEAAGRGSGFIVSPDGYAITNNHVVTGAGTLKVWRGGDKNDALSARIVGSSECMDLAVVKIDDDDLPFLDYHDGAIDTADEVYAAGFPLGDPTFTMTKGIVSKSDTPADTPWASLDHVIEHDAKIRSGNSGGPLVDPEGRIVGVNYAGSDVSDTNLAIHRDELQKIVEDLKNGTNVLSLGLNGEALTDENGDGLGIWVNSVSSGSAADKAGVRAGDLLTSMEGVSLGAEGTLAEYCDVLETHGTDAALSVEVFRSEDGSYLRGQFNGTPLRETTTISSGVVSASSSATSAATSTATGGGFTTVTDDSGVVTVDVPDAWSEVDGTQFVDDKNNSFYGIEASSDLAAYQGGWGAVGASVMASDQAVSNSTPEELLDWAGKNLPDSGCVSKGRQDYTDALHTGRFEVWENCGDEKAKYLVVATTADTGEYMALIAVQANSEADVEAADRVVNSFTVEL